MKKVFIITGEHSGDIHASMVAKRLFELNHDIEIEGIGGENLKAAGVKLFSDHKKIQTGFGFADGLRRIQPQHGKIP